jgi:hypothetical protein
MSDVTRILYAIEKGDPTASELLLPLVYDELRKLALGSARVSDPAAPPDRRSPIPPLTA